jgi:hypothetical protein
VGGNRLNGVHQPWQAHILRLLLSFRNLSLAFGLSMSVLILSACAPATAIALETPTQTPTELATLTPTPTIIWFPATPTFTPAPTRGITPTPDLSVVHGSELLSDDFSDSTSWQLSKSMVGNVAMGDNRLNIAINQPRVILFSLREGVSLGDFYLEVTSRANLCRGLDEYGIMVRVASAADFLRFGISCDGQVRMDRITSNSVSSPQPWTPSGTVPPGAPGESRLGVWAQGKEIHFYVNGELQFTVNEPTLLEGQIGVFARSNTSDTVSISFSDLVIYSARPVSP